MAYGKMGDRRGYEADDLRKAARDVERKGGKKAYKREMRHERKDYLQDEEDFQMHKYHDGHMKDHHK